MLRCGVFEIPEMLCELVSKLHFCMLSRVASQLKTEKWITLCKKLGGGWVKFILSNSLKIMIKQAWAELCQAQSSFS